MGGKEDEGARIFSVVPSDSTRENGDKLKCVKFHPNIKPLFYFGGSQTLEQVAQKL